MLMESIVTAPSMKIPTLNCKYYKKLSCCYVSKFMLSFYISRAMGVIKVSNSNS